nr:ribonuclease H-like domain-containing protein [Tanacetum cinerariifolium]
MQSRGTLLMALLNKDQLKLHSYQDAKLVIEAIKKRYGGNKDPRSTSSTNEADTTASEVSTAHTQGNRFTLGDAMLTIRARRFIKRTGRNLDINGQRIGFDKSKVECFNCHRNLDINGQRIGFDKSKVECFNCHKNGHFARECRALKNQDNRGSEYGRKTIPVETSTENALITQDGIGGYDWSYQAKAELPKNYALMALTSLGNSSSFDSEIDSYFKTCMKAYANLKEEYDSLNSDEKKSQFNLLSYKAGNYMPPKRDLRLIYEHVESVSVDVISNIATSDLKTVESKHKTVDINHKSVFNTVKPKPIRKNNFSPPLIEDWHSDDESEFCEDKGIKREYSVARTPQQNGVAERRKRKLIEAARTMLVDSKLPTTFWAEVVNTACYVLNRALVTKPHNKTPYELICGRPPLIDFMKPFGCLVTILNTRDNLGKFEGKVDEGYFVGYSMEIKLMVLQDPKKTLLRVKMERRNRKHKFRKTKRNDIESPQTNVLIEHVVDEAANEKMDDSLERATTTATSLDAERDRGNIKTTKTSQAQEITSLKKWVKRLEKKKRSRTHGLKRLYKVRLSTRVESSADEESLDEDIFGVNDQDDTSMFDTDKDLQGKEVVVEKEVVGKDVSAIEEVNAATIATFVTGTTTTAAITPTISMDEITLAKALIKIKTSRPKAKGIVMQEPSETPTPTPIVSSQQPSKVQDKGKGIMVEEPLKIKKKDQISFDKQEALRLQAEFDEEERLSRGKMKPTMLSKKTKEIAQEGSSKRARDELEQDIAKKQRIEDKNESAELKRCLEIVSDDRDDVTIDATFFKMYLTFSKLIKNFDREDLEVLWRLVKDRFVKIKPVDDIDSFLMHTLKTMFEHHVDDTVWKSQQGLTKVKNWKLFDSYGVHCVTM